MPGWTSTTSRRGSPSSSMRIRTSSRRSPSTGRRAGSGPRVMRDRFRRQSRALVEAALPRADGGRFADRAAAVQQRRPHGVQALAAVLGGTNSLHTNSLDEALALPTAGGRDARAANAADHRARERRRRAVVDPLGGARTSSSASRATWSERRADYFEPHRRHGRDGGGDRAGLSRSGKSPRASYRFQQAVERKEQIIVGVNDFVQRRRAADRRPSYIDEAAGERQLARLEAAKATRNADAVGRVARRAPSRCRRARPT